MSIIHQTLTQTKTVSKPWGQEKWIQQGSNEHTYVLKEIVLNQGHQTSLQVHQYKAETNYILEGSGRIVYSKEYFDCEWYNAGGYSQEEMDNFILGLHTEIYGAGSVMTI